MILSVSRIETSGMNVSYECYIYQKLDSKTFEFKKYNDNPKYVRFYEKLKYQLFFFFREMEKLLQ